MYLASEEKNRVNAIEAIYKYGFMTSQKLIIDKIRQAINSDKTQTQLELTKKHDKQCGIS